MSIFDRLLGWFRGLLAPSPKGSHERRTRPPISFPKITHTEKPPRNMEVQRGELYFVASEERPKWVMFQCPCGCQSIITLSLQHAHRPHWSLVNSRDNRPSLHPSVWRDVGCLSHFWIRDGRVFWCDDTGTLPWK